MVVVDRFGKSFFPNSSAVDKYIYIIKTVMDIFYTVVFIKIFYNGILPKNIG